MAVFVISGVEAEVSNTRGLVFLQIFMTFIYCDNFVVSGKLWDHSMGTY